MTLRGISEGRFHRPLVGALLTIACGLALWVFPLGDSWIDASYDNLFRFGSPEVTNQLVVVLMDNESYAQLTQSRVELWDRTLHAKLLKKLADDGCRLLAMDIFFESKSEAGADAALIAEMSRIENVVLAGEQASVAHPGLESARPLLPIESILVAAKTNWGVAWLDPDAGDFVVRRHWPFPSPGPYPSLPWMAAELGGAVMEHSPVKRWVRYYDLAQSWTTLSYHVALAKGPGYFRDKIVFLGVKPNTPLPDRERDEFCTPHFKWTNEAVGGVEILATIYLNLVRGDWLKRMAWPVEMLSLIVFGSLMGAGLCRLKPWLAVTCSVGAALTVVAGAAGLSYFSNYWFPWLLVAGAQLPLALGWALIPARRQLIEVERVSKPSVGNRVRIEVLEDSLPDAPEYEIITPEIGQGGFGKVWIARNAIGQWQALKAVYESKFNGDRGPYETEFKGLRRYKPVSERHPGLLRIDLVSKMKEEGYFYYVMELGDAQNPGWEEQPSLYRPKDLENLRKQAAGCRLPPKECLHIVTVLAEALAFLHQQGLTHRDIKPSNVIFVNGRPKLADVGLVADIRPVDQINTLVGTPGYMPPPPEKPGTPQADIFALGMLLYVIATGRSPALFPDLATTLIEQGGHAEFMRLNTIILKACQPDISKRYQAVTEVLSDLVQIEASN